MKRVLLATAMGVAFTASSFANPVFFNGPVNGQVVVNGYVPILCGALFTAGTSTADSITGGGNSWVVNLGNLDANNNGIHDQPETVSGSVSFGCNTKAVLEIDNANAANGTESGLYNPAPGAAGFTNYVEYNLVVGPISTDSDAISVAGWLSHTWNTPFLVMNAPLSLTTKTGTTALVAGNYSDTIYVKLTPSL
ncbi:MAG: hypothetical protein QM698_07055 [Micropepsaceae bacterium]